MSKVRNSELWNGNGNEHRDSRNPKNNNNNNTDDADAADVKKIFVHCSRVCVRESEIAF